MSALAKLEESGITLGQASFGGAFDRVGNTYRKVTIARWLCAKFKIGYVKGTKVADIKAKVDEAQFKAARKEFDGHVRDFYRASGLGNGQLAADPTLRKELRFSVDKEGNPTGRSTCIYTPVKGANPSGPSARELVLEKELAALRLQLTAPASA